MSWLSEWLKEIIMLILLAAFVDLLLPSTKMQRYVKLMLSLIILLALLSPIMKLFDNSMTDDVAAEWEQMNPSTSAFASLTSIQRDAARLQQQRQRQVNDLASSQLETNMMQQLNQMLAQSELQIQKKAKSGQLETSSQMESSSTEVIRATEVDVKLALAPNQSEPAIHTIKVVIKQSAASVQPQSNSSTSSDAIPTVEQVQEVNIKSEPIDIPPASQPKSNDSSSTVSDKDNPPDRIPWNDRIIAMLTAQWLVKAEQIHIEWVSE